MSRTPSYTIEFPRPAYWRGDVVDGFELRLTNEAGDPLRPLSVCCQIKGEDGKVVYEYKPRSAPDGTVSFEDVVADWLAGYYTFDIEYTLGGGKKRTYVRGSLTIRQDISQC